MSHTLHFASLQPYDAGLASISIPVTLVLGSEVADLEAVLDTGATYGVFQREVGEMLGLDIETGTKLAIETVTDAFVVYGHSVTLWVAGLTLDTIIYFAAEYGFPKNILGRKGFVDRLRIGLVDYDGALFVSHYDDDE